MSTKMSGCDGCSRRTLLKGLGLAALAPLVLDALAGCQPGSSAPTANTTTCAGGLCIDLGDSANAALATAGGALLVDTASDTILVVRVSDTSVIALSAVCTHSGCIVDYNASAQRIDCACHGSQFTETGAVIRGPARRALTHYTATLSGTTITIAA